MPSETAPVPAGRRVAVSIVCVFNDPHVLALCLARSVEEGRAAAPRTELIAVDNTTGTHPTAGSALNQGARQAHNDVVVFAHQDVVLHSLPELEAAAADLMADDTIGMLGAVGVDARSTVIGNMRDRVVRIGEPASTPRDVDTLDEVLFLLRRTDVLEEPLAEDPALAWHAYAAEYGLRVRRAGRRVTARDVPLTHNSMTTNLARLDEAHRRLAELYPELLPVATTCGVVRSERVPTRAQRAVRKARGARTWLHESRVARRVAPHSGAGVVLADIRVVLDDAARLGGFEEIRVLDVQRSRLTPLRVDGIERLNRRVSGDSLPLTAVDEEIARRPASRLLLVANATEDELGSLRSLHEVPHVVGYWRDTGLWVLVGARPDTLAELWSQPRNRPFGGLLPLPGARA